MLERDNCPVCGTTCALEFEEGETSYATCKTCKTRWRRRDDPKVLGKMIYEKWACRIPEFTLTIPFIGSSMKFQPKLCRWIKVKETHIPVPRKGETFEETISVEAEDYEFYSFELKRRDKVECEIVSDEPVHILFMDEKNFDKFSRAKWYEIEDTTENVYKTKTDFEATKKGLWFVVIKNPQREPAKVKVHLYSLHKTGT